MDPLRIINKFASSGSLSYDILVEHGFMVRDKATAIAVELENAQPDLAFIREAAMLHDIGIVLVNEPRLGCKGDMPYICHGYLGRLLLENEGYPLHALVCERHIGAGFSIHDIKVQGLPLPERDMQPVSLEEKIICYADKFFSKRIGHVHKEKSLSDVRKEMEKFGAEKLRAFDRLHALFSKKPFQEKDRQQGQ